MWVGCLDETTVLAFLDGRLPPAARGDVEAHLATCSACTDLTTWTAADIASRRDPGGERRAMIGDLSVGSRVGRYQILGAIGRGGMGEVYAAHHPDLDRRIALKIVHESGADSHERRTRLLREARAIARLSHPNVVAVYDAGAVGDRVYIAMELVEGQTVDVWLRASRRTWREVLDVFIPAGRGLAAAHAAEIIHRDFKPQNIMIGKDWSVRVMDFGLARLVSEDAGTIPHTGAAGQGRAGPFATVTRTGALVGTPAYMAPEQFRGQPTDARADQFSFCVALHEALYGARPRLPHLESTGGTQATSPESSTSSRRSIAPAWLRGIVLRGLSPDRERRFPSMDALLRALENGRTRSRRRSAMTAAMVTVALIALAGWRLSNRPRYDCLPPASRLAAVWPASGAEASRRELLHQALLASGRTEAPAVWRQLSSALDDHVGRWRAMYQETCEATQVRGDQSGEVLDLRMRCLGENLDEVRALTDVLIGADARAVGQAVGATASLTPVTMCADSARLRSKVPLPRNERTRRTVETLRQPLNDARALRDLGYWQAALDKAGALRPQVEATRSPSLLAELLETIGLIETDFGAFGEAEVFLKEAIVAAEAGNDDAIRAQAASILIFALGLQGRHDESRLWAGIANAILDRLGPGHARSRAWVVQGQAVVLLAEADFEAARTQFAQAIALKEQTLGRNHPDVAISLLGLGLALKSLGRLEPALEAEDRALAIWKEQGSSFAAKAQNNRGEILTALRRNAEAEEAFTRALQGLEKETGPDNVDVAHPLTGLGEVKLAAGAPDAAISFFERALRLREEKEKEPTLVAETRFGLARALWDGGGNRLRALSLARSARDVYSKADRAAELQKVEGWLAGRTRAPTKPTD